MASEEQYNCFVEIYDREISRQERIVDRGKIYLSVVTLYFGLLGVSADKVVPNIRDSLFVIAAYILSLSAFMIAMILIVRALGIYRYVYPTNPETVLADYGAAWPPENEAFYDSRIAELATAFTNNHPITERRGTLLRFATHAIVIGSVLQAFVLASLLFVQTPK